MFYQWVCISLISVFKCLNYDQFKELYFFEDQWILRWNWSQQLLLESVITAEDIRFREAGK